MRRRKIAGYTIIEIWITLVIAVTLMTIALPLFGAAMDNHRLNGAVRRVISDTRLARSKAVSTRWRYRIFAYGDTSATRPNEYRIEGTSTAGFPAPTTDGPLSTGTQEASRWINLSAEYMGVRINPGGAATFDIAFDEAGYVTSPLTSITIQRGTADSRTVQPYRPGYVKCTNC